MRRAGVPYALCGHLAGSQISATAVLATFGKELRQTGTVYVSALTSSTTAATMLAASAPIRPHLFQRVRERVVEPAVSSVRTPEGRSHLARLTRLGVRAASARLLHGRSERPSLETAREEGLHFASRPSEKDEFLTALLGDESYVWNLLGLKATFGSMVRGLWQYGQVVGLRQFVSDYRHTFNSRERLPINPAYLDKGRRVFGEWCIRYAAANNIDVQFEGLEKIPAEGPVVYAMGPHSSIFPDFLFAIADPRLGFVAAADNFRDNLAARIMGFSLLSDELGIPLVDRNDIEWNKVLYPLIIQTAMEFGIRPAWWWHGRRLPEAYNDEGHSDRVGYYSAVDPIKDGKFNPLQYRRLGGVIDNALELAIQSQQTVKLIVVTVDGAETVMPKRTSKFPFWQENRAGKTVRYKVVEVIDVEPPQRSKRALVRPLSNAIEEATKEDMGIDQFLAATVTRWGALRGYANSGERFLELARRDRKARLFMVADRIRSIHPASEDKHSRRELIDRLLHIVHAEAGDNEAERIMSVAWLDLLLHDVSEQVSQTQYRPPRRLSA